MSATFNISDFQCLQDQLVDLKTKNYELAEKNRRSQTDFEAAKAKICSLQLKLEEQERDFQVTSTTLRREIESLVTTSGNTSHPNDSNHHEPIDEDQKAKYKKLLHKAKELQQRYDKSLEVVQQLDNQNKLLTEKCKQIEEENVSLKESLTKNVEQLESMKKENEVTIQKAIEDYKSSSSEIEEQDAYIKSLMSERDQLRADVEKLTAEMDKFDRLLKSLNEDRKIQERKGLQIVKELKRQLTLEKNRSGTLQKRLEQLISEQITDSKALSAEDTLSLGPNKQFSSTSSTNGNSNCSSNGIEGSKTNQTNDTNSVGSWSFVPSKNIKSSQIALNETLSLCSIDSEDRETVQQPCDNSDSTDNNSSIQRNSSDLMNNNISYPRQQQLSLLSSTFDYQNSSLCPTSDASGGMLSEEQAALVDRVTKLQQDKWMLEEKLSYLEQANSSLTQDLANKSDIIKHYFMEQAKKTLSNQSAIVVTHNHQANNFDGHSYSGSSNITCGTNNSRRTSFPNNVNFNNLLTEKPSIKKVVDFLKDKSHQVSSSASSTLGESENISREATKKMQLMLEETLIKCLKLQENLDYVTSELNKLKC